MRITKTSKAMTVDDIEVPASTRRWIQGHKMADDHRDAVGEWCQVCTFFRRGHNATDGRCHRFPPAFDPERESCFPLVSRYDWCGEFVYSQEAASALMATEGEGHGEKK